MDAKTQVHGARTTTFGCIRSSTTNQLLSSHQRVSSASTWSEGCGLKPTDAALTSGQSGRNAAEDLTVWAQDLLELLDDSLAQMQAMQEPRASPDLAIEGDSYPALRITEVDDEDDGDSVLTASNSVSSGGPSSCRADLSPTPYIVDEEEVDNTPSPQLHSTPARSCTEIIFESTKVTSPPTSGTRRGRTLYETLMNRSNIRSESSPSPSRPRISAFSLGISSTNYSDDSSDEEKDAVCIEQVQDIDQLEKMLNESKQYEMRRRIRAQIRAVRKTLPAVCTPGPDELVTSSSSSPPVRPTSMFTDLTRNALGDFHSDFPIKAHLFTPSGLTIDEGYSSVTSPMSPMDCSDSSFEASSPPSSTKMGDSYINGVNLLDIEDEIELHNLLDQTEDIDDRKRVRNRLREVMAIHREQREEMRNHREQERENLLRKKVADADEQKRRTLAMYDAMAKSAPAGGNKTLDVNILRTGEEEGFASDEDNSMKENVPNKLVVTEATSSNSVRTSNSSLFSYWSAKSCSTATLSSHQHVQHVVTVASTTQAQHVGGEKLDLIEDAIRARQRNCDETKAKTLAAFDKAARMAPAGSARIVDFNNVTDEDIREKENTPKYTSTFQMSGGVPLSKASAPRIAPRHVEPERDLMEEAIRKRQAESDERKRRTLAAYDQAARSRPAGAPVTVYIPQNYDIEPVVVSLVSRVKDGSKPGTPSTMPNTPRPVQQQAVRQQTVVKPQPQQPATRPQVNIKTQSSVRTVNNPYQNERPAAPPQPTNLSSSRTTVTTQKIVSPAQVQQRQVTTTVTTQSTRTVQQQQQQQQQIRQQQQRYIEESEEEEEEEEELEEDY